MTSNLLFVWHRWYKCPTFLRPHISLVVICGVACVVLQRELHHRHYSSLPRVSSHCALFQFHSFLCDTISTEEYLHLPRLSDSSTWIASDIPVCEASSSDKQCDILAIRTVITIDTLPLMISSVSR